MKEIAAIRKTLDPLIEMEKKAVAAKKENAGGFGFGPPGGGFGVQLPELPKFIEKRTESITAQIAGKSKGTVPTGFGPGPGGPGGACGPGGGRPRPGEVLAAPLQGMLQLTAEQKKELAELQKDVDARLEKIFTPTQREQLKRMQGGR